jgi:hypothetical protein
VAFLTEHGQLGLLHLADCHHLGGLEGFVGQFVLLL